MSADELPVSPLPGTTGSASGARHRVQRFSLDTMDVQTLRPGFSRTGIRTDDAVTTVNWFEPGYTTVGPHSHPFDQLSYVLSGAMRFYIDGEPYDVVAPGAIYIPADLPHCAEPLGTERVLNLDVFSPARHDYLALCEHQGDWDGNAAP